MSPTKRRAPAEATRILGELIEQLPYEPTFPHEFQYVVYEPAAIHLVQQVCWAIKQHNEWEDERKQQRWEEQIAQGKKPGGVVTLPDYISNKIPWVLKYKYLDKPKDKEDMNQLPGYQPRVQLYADLPRGRKRKVGVMAKLINEMFPPKVPEIIPTQDPFDKWLNNTPAEPPTGVDEHPPIMQTTNPRNERGIPTLGTCPDLPPHQADI